MAAILLKHRVTPSMSIRNHSTYTNPTYDVSHPHVSAPSYVRSSRILREACRKPECSFYPIGYHRAKYAQSIRTGEYLGKDWPWCFTRKPYKWAKRVYNVKQDRVPIFTSSVKGVSWYPRLNQWQAQWVEDGVHHTRGFKAAFGVLSAKKQAEEFKKSLIVIGRVDNMQTERQLRATMQRKQAALTLKKKVTFTRNKEDLIAEWDRYWNNAKFHWEDNHLKTQRKKLGKIVDPKYRPPDIDIAALRKIA